MPVIHAHVNDLSASLFYKPKRTDRASIYTVVCEAPDRCEVHARGACICRRFLGGGCKYGRAIREDGPTRKAAKYREWVNAAKARAEGIPQLESPASKLARVGDFVWLPYAFMGLVFDPGAYFGPGSVFKPSAEFDAAMVAMLCGAKPRALFGDVITAYQREEVPKFVAHLQELMPDLLAKAAALSPRIRELGVVSKVGRKALLRTMAPCVGMFARHPTDPRVWAWDGQRMACADKAGFPAFTPFDAVEVSIIPGPDTVVQITDDAQVLPATVFVD